MPSLPHGAYDQAEQKHVGQALRKGYIDGGQRHPIGESTTWTGGASLSLEPIQTADAGHFHEWLWAWKWMLERWTTRLEWRPPSVHYWRITPNRVLLIGQMHAARCRRLSAGKESLPRNAGEKHGESLAQASFTPMLTWAMVSSVVHPTHVCPCASLDHGREVVS